MWGTKYYKKYVNVNFFKGAKALVNSAINFSFNNKNNSTSPSEPKTLFFFQFCLPPGFDPRTS